MINIIDMNGLAVLLPVRVIKAVEQAGPNSQGIRSYVRTQDNRVIETGESVFDIAWKIKNDGLASGSPMVSVKTELLTDASAMLNALSAFTTSVMQPTHGTQMVRRAQFLAGAKNVVERIDEALKGSGS